MFDSYNWIARFCPNHHYLLSTIVSHFSKDVFFTFVGFSPAKYSLANFSQASISRIDSSLTSDLTRELELGWKRVHIPSTTCHTRTFFLKSYLEFPPTVLADPLVLEFELFLELSVEQEES